MRLLVLAGAFSIAAISLADRLITIPTGRKVPFGSVRYEVRFEPSRSGAQEQMMAVGVNSFVDMELRADRERGARDAGTFDLSYNYIAPIQGISPGISFGVQDAVDHSSDGRRFFGVITYREPYNTLDGEYPADITLGIFAGKHWSPFVGVSIPFSKAFHFLAEHNGNRVSAGFEFRPASWINLRSQEVGRHSEIGVQLTSHF